MSCAVAAMVMQMKVIDMRNVYFASAAMAAGVLLAAPAFAQRPDPGTGPVAAACQNDIETLCPDTTHGQGAARACLEKNKAKVSADCAAALDSTGPGRGRGRGPAR